MSETWFGLDGEKRARFDAAYVLHWPPPVQELMAMPTRSTEEEKAKNGRAIELARSGYLIDVAIMAWGWDPYSTMFLREGYGYAWVPSGLQAGGGGAGDMPAGALKVSTNPDDFPPFAPPVPIPPFDPNEIGNSLEFSMPFAGIGSDGVVYTGTFPVYSARAQSTSQDGQIAERSGAKFLFHLLGNLFGPRQRAGVWLKVA